MHHTSCPLHPRASSQPIVKAAQDQFWGYGGCFDYEKCDECGTWYITPVPSDAILKHHYAGSYSEAELNALRRRYTNTPPNYGVDGLRAWDTLRAFDTLGFRVSHKDTILDVGCGSGGFLAKMRAARGAKVRGLDTNERCINFVKEVHGIDADCGTLEEQKYGAQTFSMVTAWHCLEHTLDPEKELALIHQCLKRDGWLVVEVPTAGFFAHFFRRRWVFLQPPTHLYHFSESALRELIERQGFIVRHVKKPWLPTELAGSLLCALGMNRFAPRMLFERGRLSNYVWRLALYLLMPIDVLATLFVTSIGQGSSLRVIAQKKEKL